MPPVQIRQARQSATALRLPMIAWLLQMRGVVLAGGIARHSATTQIYVTHPAIWGLSVQGGDDVLAHVGCLQLCQFRSELVRVS